MFFATPRLGEVVNSRTCQRLGVDEVYCGAHATHHIIWTAEIDNSLSCDRHTVEAREYWCFLGVHPIEPACHAKNAKYLIDEDRCIAPDDPQLVAAVADGTVVPA